jgi:hypothetical protein
MDLCLVDFVSVSAGNSHDKSPLMKVVPQLEEKLPWTGQKNFVHQMTAFE